ncbi:MAG: tetratricopeptide repeat protein, partial [Flavobacterium sp.]
MGAKFDHNSNYDEAIECYENALELCLAYNGEKHLSVADSHVRIGLSNFYNGNNDTAIKSYLQALEIYLASFQHQEDERLAVCYEHIGAAYCAEGHYQKGLHQYEKALKIFNHIDPEGNPDILELHHQMGIILDRLHRYDDAVHSWEKVIKMNIELFGHNNAALGEANFHLGMAAFNKKDYKLATDSLYKAAGIYHKRHRGDSEELWENLMESVIKHNNATFKAEKLFIKRKAFTKIFGNHDLYWDNDPLSQLNLKRIYDEVIRIYEGAILRFSFDGKQFDIFLTHGHQGDLQSDGNWFSKWFVSTIWAPIQAYLQINPNTPAYSNQLKTVHNSLMYSWVQEQNNIGLITGHTHQPVFASLTHLERLYIKLTKASAEKNENEVNKITAELSKMVAKGEAPPKFNKYKSAYFNSGCCCFNDGDITGIEIDSGLIRLIKWSYQKTDIPLR